jgi:rfaE bifunctional protein kinase chain/domain
MAFLDDSIGTSFATKTIAIIGDLVADQFLDGTISRVSREAPVFILSHKRTTTLPGAAANAAANVASLGGSPVLFGLVGEDANGASLTAALTKCRVDPANVIADLSLTTTTKVRVLAGQHYAARQQVIRIDYENSTAVPVEVKDKMTAALTARSDSFDAIIVSDYGYGAVFPEIFAEARDIARRRGIPIIVDSRYRLETFTGATAATPNREEVEQIAGKDFTDGDCADLRERLACEALLVTNGNKGMSLYTSDEAPRHIDVVGSPEPVDVTGAGDTVIAAFALGLASGLSFADAATIANHAGGIVVMKKRTATVTMDELVSSLGSNPVALASNQTN